MAPTIQETRAAPTVNIENLPLMKVPEGEIAFNPYEFPEIVSYDSAGPGRVQVYQQVIAPNGESLGFAPRWVDEKDLDTILPKEAPRVDAQDVFVPLSRPQEAPRVGIYEQMHPIDTKPLRQPNFDYIEKREDKVGAHVTLRQHPYSQQRLEILKNMINPPRR